MVLKAHARGYLKNSTLRRHAGDGHLRGGRRCAIGRRLGLLLGRQLTTTSIAALLTVLGGFPANCPATVITQHMPATFTASFAARLDRVCAPVVTEAVDGAPLKPGHVYLAPGGATHLEVSAGLTPRCRRHF